MVLFLPPRILLDGWADLILNIASTQVTPRSLPLELSLLGILNLLGNFVISSDRCDKSSKILVREILEQSLDELWNVIFERNLAELDEIERSTTHMLLLVNINIES